MKKYGLLILLAALALCASCRKVSDPILSYGQKDSQVFSEAEKSFEKQFTALWTALNCNYGIWDYEAEFGLDWDAVLTEYLPRFQALDKQETVTDAEFKALYEEVLNPLHDGHLAIQVKNLKTNNFATISPSANRIMATRKEALQRDMAFNPDYSAYLAMTEGPLRITESKSPVLNPTIKAGRAVSAANSLVEARLAQGAPAEDAPAEEKLIYRFCQEYKADVLEMGKAMVSADTKKLAAILNAMADKYAMLGSLMGFELFKVDSGLVDMDPGIQYHLFNGNIPYLRISDFRLSPWMDDAILKEFVTDALPYTQTYRDDVRATWRAWKDTITRLKAAGQLKGVIIDLRTNGGGFMNDFRYVVGTLVPSGGFSAFKLRTKQGIGRYDYSPLVDGIFPTLDEEHTVIDTEPIVVLCNTRSVSMAEISSYSVKSLPNGCLIGSRTWGGLSALNPDPSEYSRVYASVVGEMNVTPFYAYIPMMISLFPGEGIKEGQGITPDIELDLDSALLLTQHRDNQLERAVNYIINGN